MFFLCNAHRLCNPREIGEPGGTSMIGSPRLQISPKKLEPNCPHHVDRASWSCYDGPGQHTMTRKLQTMPKTLHIQTTVMPGGRIVVVDQDLAEGETVEVFVTKSPPTTQRSAIDILAEAPGHRVFETEDAVNDYLESERESWER